MPTETFSAALAPKAVVGLGNPDRTDDGVGVAVVLGLSPRPGVEILTAVKTGMDLAMALLPYARALLVDAAPFLPPGEVALFPLQAREARGFPHGADLAQALGWLAALGARVPEVWVLAVGVPQEPGFGRNLSPQVQDAIPLARKVVERWLAS
jgi:hydrogenase maturation protease